MNRMYGKEISSMALIAILAISMIMVFVSPVSADTDKTSSDLAEMQKAIGESGAEWQAGITSVSGLSPEEKERLCGLKIRRHTKDLGREGELKVEALAEDPNALTARRISPEKISRWASMPPFASPGEVLGSWTADNTYVWGVGFDGTDVWISDPYELEDYEYTTTGTYISNFATPWGADWGADFAWNSNTNTLWQVHVGGDNCIYELDPANGAVLSTICDPAGIWNLTSKHGLAYDAATDTFYVGGWSDGIVYHIQGPTLANPGAIIDSFGFGLNWWDDQMGPGSGYMSGLAFAPDGTLWIATQWCPDMLYQVDLTTHEVIQCFAHPEYQCFTAGGLACDGDGNLWMVSQATNTVYHVDTAGVQAPAFDWRDHSGDWTTPIRDQEDCGSCWAFGALCSMESHINIQNADPTIDMDLSEQYLLSCSEGDCDGWYVDAVLDYLRDIGTTDEACFPYQADDTIPCSDACDDADCRTLQTTDWDWVPLSTYEIQGHLLDAPLVTGMEVYSDFFDYEGGIYEHVYGDFIGYHLVNMVGYNDTEHYWICKNSWNTTWGENGWFRIRYGECGIEMENAYIIPPITESDMKMKKVNKTVFDETTGEWVDSINADVGDTVRFRVSIPNPCNNLTDVEVNDILADGLEYADDATVNGETCEPEEIILNPDTTTSIKWMYNASKSCTEPFQELEVSESITIEFDAHVTECGTNLNRANATAYCEECNPPRQVFAHEDCAKVVPMMMLFCEDFEGTFPPAEWTVVNNGGDCVWERNDLTGRTNYAGGDGYCADADSDWCGSGTTMDTELRTPSFSLGGYSSAELSFIASYNDYSSTDYADVNISMDGGATWTNLLQWDEDHDARGSGELVTIDLTSYVGNPDVMISWHYYTLGWDWWYEIDDVAVGVCGGAIDLEFGDAPDHTYPSLLASDGVRHLPTEMECIGLQTAGDWKDYEPDARVPDQDTHDDGLVTTTITAGDPAQTVTFEVTEMTGSGNLIANILIDLNIDGDWDDPGEHVVVNQPIPIAGGDGVVVSNTFSTVGAAPGSTWMRITLTRSMINPGWDGTMTGFAQTIPFEYGETEDWEIYIEGEAPPTPTPVPTLTPIGIAALIGLLGLIGVGMIMRRR